ncbi:MAG: hypothetical protein U5K31_14515 [Balneolaceae bacterium]|nr:hypothetical protein [Balneolaceae bacterium]
MSDTKELFSEDIPFAGKASALYRLQRAENPVYGRFCDALGAPEQVSGYPDDFPLLPVRAFADAEVITPTGENGVEDDEEDLLFRSSGTGGGPRSVHRVPDPERYRDSLLRGFRRHYRLESSAVWACTPGYSENPDSSLIWMLRELIEASGSPLSRFLPLGEAYEGGAVEVVQESGRSLVLFGAAFGLLDLLEAGAPPLPSDSVVIETGGMKTRRREMNRDELHRRLSRGFGLDISRVHSEYGMAEMLSQAYATGGSWFHSPPWLGVTVRDPDDPSRALPPGQEGLLGFVDLANRHSCAFLLTGDRGAHNGKGKFRVEGRWKPDNMRGCNFLIDRD